MSAVTIGGSYKIKSLYLLNCITPLHVGTGQSYEEFVDLPIQRDNIGFPVIWGSSIKGALRNAYRNASNKSNDNLEYTIFGSEINTDELYASSLLITDASLLLMPVRSLYGLFAFCTNPYLLRQCIEKLNMIDASLAQELESITNFRDCKCSDNYIVKDNKITLKEEEISINVDSKIKEVFNKLLPASLPQRENILNRIVVLNDDYADIIKRSTIVQTRIALDYEKKIVKEGALFTEEYLPEMSMLVTLFLFRDSRKGDKDANSLLKELDDRLGINKDGKLEQFYLITGGNETLGRGIIRYHKIR